MGARNLTQIKRPRLRQMLLMISLMSPTKSHLELRFVASLAKSRNKRTSQDFITMNVLELTTFGW
jgi:hypothetical protein